VEALLRHWKPIVALLALCLGALLVFNWRRLREDGSPAMLLARLPAGSTIQVFVDIHALREVGLLDMLAGSRAVEETDYRQFVDATGFDYRQHLDTIVGARRGEDWYFLLRGTFRWDRISKYAQAQSGTCQNAFCSIPSQRPGRYTSFYTVLPNVLAMASADRPNAAFDLARPSQASRPEQDLQHPVWLRFTTQALPESANLPPGTRPLATALQRSQSATFSLDASGTGFEARLTATFLSESDAGRSKAHLQEMTGILRSFLSRAKQKADPRELAGVLASGQFEQRGTTVTGKWPIEKQFLEAAASGSF
jgi:hypothetical protein